MSIVTIANIRDSFPKRPLYRPLGDMFWGDRYGQLVDPFGHHWSVGTHIRDVSIEEAQQAMQKGGA